VGLSVGQAVKLAHAEASQGWEVTLGVLIVNLDHAADKELLLFCRAGLPVVRLGNGHGEALLSRPLFLLRLVLILGVQMDIVFDGRELFHGPRFANGEGAVGVFSRLVQLDPPSVPNTNHDDARLLVGGRCIRRWGGLGVGAIFQDADVGDVRFLDYYLSASLRSHSKPLCCYVRCPWSSTLAKQLSVMRRRSSSKRSARDMPDGVELELVVDGGPLAPPGGGRFGSPKPLG
jgi:hypothetical protein